MLQPIPNNHNLHQNHPSNYHQDFSNITPGVPLPLAFGDGENISPTHHHQPMMAGNHGNSQSEHDNISPPPPPPPAPQSSTALVPLVATVTDNNSLTSLSDVIPHPNPAYYPQYYNVTGDGHESGDVLKQERQTSPHVEGGHHQLQNDGAANTSEVSGNSQSMSNALVPYSQSRHVFGNWVAGGSHGSDNRSAHVGSGGFDNTSHYNQHQYYNQMLQQYSPTGANLLSFTPSPNLPALSSAVHMSHRQSVYQEQNLMRMNQYSPCMYPGNHSSPTASNTSSSYNEGNSGNSSLNNSNNTSGSSNTPQYMGNMSAQREVSSPADSIQSGSNGAGSVENMNAMQDFQDSSNRRMAAMGAVGDNTSPINIPQNNSTLGYYSGNYQFGGNTQHNLGQNSSASSQYPVGNHHHNQAQSHFMHSPPNPPQAPIHQSTPAHNFNFPAITAMMDSVNDKPDSSMDTSETGSSGNNNNGGRSDNNSENQGNNIGGGAGASGYMPGHPSAGQGNGRGGGESQFNAIQNTTIINQQNLFVYYK